jgi:hypothetical protein
MKKFNCYICEHEGLPEDEKKRFRKDGEDDETEYIVIESEGGKTKVYHDDLEPEDCKFCRDLSWIETEINNAYRLGLKHGAENNIMIPEKVPPKRKIQVSIKINADDFESLHQEFRNVYLEKIGEKNFIPSSVSGSVSSSHMYGCIINSEQTAENYQRELADYIEGKNK